MKFISKIVLFCLQFFWGGAIYSESFHDTKGITSYSQASQDQFVHIVLNKLCKQQASGYYLEIGAGHPITNSNTYLFEKTFNWKGVSLDIDSEITQDWHLLRQNPLIKEDATQADYQSILKTFPQVIDYLSLDVDDNYDAILSKMPFNEYQFKLITIEHDFYRYGPKYRDKERQILLSLGYHLLCPDVVIFYNGKDSIFEDWWIYPSAFSADQLAILTKLDLQGKKHDELIRILDEAIE